MKDSQKKKSGRNQFHSLLCYAAIVGMTCFIFSSCATERGISLRDKSIKEWEAYQWTTIKKSSDNEAKEWAIYSRKVKGTSFLEYKIEGEIAASPIACVASFRQDLNAHAGDSNNKKYPTYEIVDESKDSLLTYVIHNEPFPLKDTEMSVRYVFFNNEDGSAGIKWKEAWEDCLASPSKKLKRIETFRGSWSFAPTYSNYCKALNSVQFDLSGIPLWFVEPMVLKFLKEGLEDIRNNSEG